MKSKSTSELKATIHKVEEICKSNKLGLTEIRRQVFEIIIKNNKPVKAYEILDKILNLYLSFEYLLDIHFYKFSIFYILISIIWISLIGIVTGMVAGLATVTPASGYIGVPGGLILGFLGGLLCYLAVDYIRGKLQIDDSLDVFAVHGVGGILGTLLVAFLATSTFSGLGLAEGQTGTSQFIIQLKAVVLTVIWTSLFTYLILKLTSFVVSLRVDEQEEIEGLDLRSHGEKGYHSD